MSLRVLTASKQKMLIISVIAILTISGVSVLISKSPGESNEESVETGLQTEDEHGSSGEEASPAGQDENVNPEDIQEDTPFITASFEYTVLPTSEEYIGAITPLGWIGASTRSRPDLAHPLGDERHHVFFNERFSEGIEIRAPCSGYVEWTSLSHLHEWGFTIHVDEMRSYYMDHIGYLNSTLKSQLTEIHDFDESGPVNAYINRRVKVKAGQVIGYSNTTRYFDWGTVDKSRIDGISNRSHYTWERQVYGVPAYDYASHSLKPEIRSLYGIWNDQANVSHPQVDGVIGGSVRNDINGTLQGIWFYAHIYDDTWGQKIAMFSPYCLNHSNYQIRLSIPELSIYGNWQNITVNSASNLDRKPRLVNQNSGIVGYLVNRSMGVGEEGLILVQVIDDHHIRLETFEGASTMPDTPEFTEKSVILYR